MTDFWVVALCSLEEVYGRFRDTCCLHHQSDEWLKFTDVSEIRAAIIALMMEAASSSETSVNFYQTTRGNNLEDSHLHTRRRKNLKSHPLQVLFRVMLTCVQKF
jgi:hypothetical protein